MPDGSVALRSLAQDLHALQQWGASAVLSLVQAHEFAALGVSEFERTLAAAGLNWWHVPIADMHTPDAATREAWRLTQPQLLLRLQRGERVLVHCAAGLGRTGMLVGRLLVDHGGLQPDEAIALVRRTRPGTIETEAQAQFVRTGWTPS
jgi:ADP-ribosyl-[dinitrogen reductase] hydrolase